MRGVSPVVEICPPLTQGKKGKAGRKQPPCVTTLEVAGPEDQTLPAAPKRQPKKRRVPGEVDSLPPRPRKNARLTRVESPEVEGKAGAPRWQRQVRETPPQVSVQAVQPATPLQVPGPVQAVQQETAEKKSTPPAGPFAGRAKTNRTIFGRLPFELMVMILKFLPDLQSVVNVSKVCPFVNEVVEENGGYSGVLERILGEFYPEAFTVLCTSDSTLSYFEKLRRVAFTLKLKREPKDYKDGWDLDIPSMLKMERLHKTVILFAGLYARYVQDALAKPGIIADLGPLLFLDETPFLPHTCGMWDATTPFSSFAAATTHSCSCLIRAFYHFEICCDLYKAKRSLTTEVALPKVMTAGVLLRGRYGRNHRLLVPGLLTMPQQWHLHCVLLFLLRTVSVPAFDATETPWARCLEYRRSQRHLGQGTPDIASLHAVFWLCINNNPKRDERVRLFSPLSDGLESIHHLNSAPCPRMKKWRFNSVLSRDCDEEDWDWLLTSWGGIAFRDDPVFCLPMMQVD